VVLAIGAVLSEIDAVANKVVALYGRAEARDFLDAA
jgi:predicted nucleotidyltransferase component of viral defense system